MASSIQKLVHDTAHSSQKVIEIKLGRKPVFPLEIKQQLFEYFLLIESTDFFAYPPKTNGLSIGCTKRNKEEVGRTCLNHFLKSQ